MSASDWFNDDNPPRLLGEPTVTLQLKLMTDGTVEIWLDEGRPAFEVARMIHDIATGFENDARRIG